MNHGPVTRVVVVGGGTAGWMAASALNRVFGTLLDIVLVESEDIGTVGVGEATIPAIRLFNGLLDLDENAFLERTEGTIKLGIRFVDWVRKGHSYLHAFGETGLPLGGMGFHQYWLRHRGAGEALITNDLSDYSLNAQAALANRFDRPDTVKPNRLGPLVWAYHFDAGLYARYLREWAEARGVNRIEGRIVDVSLSDPDGRVASVATEKGEEVQGDLFIDCSGFRGLLIEGALKTGYDDWTDWLPCDRALAVPCASVRPLTPYTQSTARDAGWQWRIPLQHRTGNGYVYSSRFISDDEAAATLMANLEGAALAEPRPLRFTTGKRRRMWNRNVVALGLASGFMEPLESTSIHLIQAALEKLVRLFPDTRMAPALAETFNRELDAEYEAVRDFLVLHYRATERDDTPFWRHCRDLPMPTGLERKLSTWRANGSLPNEAEDLFKASSWLQVLEGQGVRPAGHHRLADQISGAQLDRYLGDVRSLVAQGVAQMRDHAAFLAAQRRMTRG